jgi:1-acyl-sn-glycerol-3-phosphate acyltransferase
MIPARHTWFHVRFFRWYIPFRMRKHFSAIRVHDPVPDTSGKPLLVIGNHFSWWDGFFIFWLNERYFRKTYYVMMLEEQLRKNMILNKSGAFSIHRGSKEIMESIGYARSILEGKEKGDENALLLMYPQGEIQSQHIRTFTFEKGLERITRGLEGRINILMVLALVDYFSSPKPELHFYFQRYPFAGELSVPDLESAFNDFHTRTLHTHTHTSTPPHH